MPFLCVFECWSTVLISVATIIGLITYYVKRQYAYWDRLGIPHTTPSFPMDDLKGVGTKRHISEMTQDIYEKFKGKDVMVGMYFFTQPSVLIIDPELIKNIMVRDFNFFHDRSIYYNERDDPLSGHLFALEGTKWKNLRAKLTPTFTSGKMKMMFETVLNVAEEMVNHLETSATVGEELEIKDILSRYTTDVIGNCAFGIDCNSIKNPEAEFRMIGRKVFEPPPYQILIEIFVGSFPNLARRLRVKTINKKVSKFFINVVKETLDYRRKNKIERKDFMQLLLQMENENDDMPSSDKLTLHEIAAQSFLFFLAGFETSSTTMTFCLYELGRHPEIQQKLRDEIESVLKKHDGKITYESILDMPYLDKVINEGLRKYPPVDSLLRTASRDYKIPNTNYVIEKGRMTIVPVFGIHRDKNIYPDPDKFDPERFNEENTAKRHPFTFLPFGEGPRACIGLRFGMMQTRLGLVTLLRKFKFSHCKRTPQTPEYIPSSPVIAIKGGVWLKIENVK